MSPRSSRETTPSGQSKGIDKTSLKKNGITYNENIYADLNSHTESDEASEVDSEVESESESESGSKSGSGLENVVLPAHVEELRRQMLDFEGIIPEKPSVSSIRTQQSKIIA